MGRRSPAVRSHPPGARGANLSLHTHIPRPYRLAAPALASPHHTPCCGHPPESDVPVCSATRQSCAGCPLGRACVATPPRVPEAAQGAGALNPPDRGSQGPPKPPASIPRQEHWDWSSGCLAPRVLHHWLPRGSRTCRADKCQLSKPNPSLLHCPDCSETPCTVPPVPTPLQGPDTSRGSPQARGLQLPTPTFPTQCPGENPNPALSRPTPPPHPTPQLAWGFQG